MNRKEIEQEVSYCYPTRGEKLSENKDFLHFLRYFPAGIGDNVKRYFNQVATGTGNFFMVPDREDKQKAVCSRCGKNIVLAADVEAVLTEILVNFRNQIRGIPSKMAPLLFGKSKPEIEELLSMEVEGRLEEIRDYTPTMFDAVDEKEGD